MTVSHLSLTGYQRGRLWIDEYPTIPNIRDIARTDRWTAKGAARAVQRKVAIEWLVPRGMGAMYGLLGAQIIPKNANFEIEVLCVDGNMGSFPETIVSSPSEQVFCGLLCEYTGSVMNGMKEAAADRINLPSAIVSCDIAAHGQVGSCDVIFRALGKALLHALLLPSTPTEMDVRPFLVIDE